MPAASPGPWKAFVEGRDQWNGDDFIRAATVMPSLTCTSNGQPPRVYGQPRPMIWTSSLRRDRTSPGSSQRFSGYEIHAESVDPRAVGQCHSVAMTGEWEGRPAEVGSTLDEVRDWSDVAAVVQAMLADLDADPHAWENEHAGAVLGGVRGADRVCGPGNGQSRRTASGHVDLGTVRGAAGGCFGL